MNLDIKYPIRKVVENTDCSVEGDCVSFFKIRRPGNRHFVIRVSRCTFRIYIFNKDAAVIVPYHLKAEDDPNKPKETADTSEAAAEETSDEGTGSGEDAQQTKSTIFNSTNDADTAKLGNSGKFSYVKRLSNYDLYILIDFDDGVVYDLQYENGNVDGTVYTIDSGDLNKGLNTIYEADGSTFVFHFHYVENPAVLIERYGSEEAKFEAASIDDTLKIKEIYESNR